VVGCWLLDCVILNIKIAVAFTPKMRTAIYFTKNSDGLSITQSGYIDTPFDFDLE
jgi:hypothetical protein